MREEEGREDRRRRRPLTRCLFTWFAGLLTKERREASFHWRTSHTHTQCTKRKISGSGVMQDATNYTKQLWFFYTQVYVECLASSSRQHI